MPLSLSSLQDPIQDSTFHPFTKSHNAHLAVTVSQALFYFDGIDGLKSTGWVFFVVVAVVETLPMESHIAQAGLQPVKYYL